MLGIALSVLLLFPMQSAQSSRPDPDDPVVVYAPAIMSEASPAAPTPAPTPRTAPTKPRKPKARLICSPRMQVRGIAEPACVSAKLLIDHPDERLWCPDVRWYIGEVFISGHVSDCVPFDTVVEEEGEPPEFWSERDPRIFALPPGEFVIKAKLLKSGKTVGVAECEVTVQ